MIPTIEQIKPIISKRLTGMLITLALLLNLLIIGIFLLIQLDLDDTSFTRHLRKMHTQIKRKFKKEQWAALQPKAGHAGAPVILAQSPQPASMPSQKNQTKLEQKIQQINQEQTQLPEPQLKEPTQLAMLEEKQEIQAKDNEKTTQEKSASVNQAIQAALAKKIKQAMQQQAQNQEKQLHTQTHKPIQQTIPKPVQPTKPQLTFAQLVKGFSEHLKREGEYNLAMAGKADAKATENQLRMGRFMQKIAQCIQTSWKVNRNKYPLNHHVLADIGLRIVIDKNGKLSNLILTKSSGRQIIDKYILDIIKDASTSFPPIPDYLHIEVCAIGCDWDHLPLPEGPSGFVIAQ